MLLETPEFTEFVRATRTARYDAYNDMAAAERQDRLTVKGQIKLEPRRTQAQADAAAAVPEKPAPTGKIIRGEKRNHVVKQLAQTLDIPRVSPFELEGACRHGVRSELCLEGHDWPHADLEAAALVDEALGRLNARRPSYDEGQREHSVSPDYCAWCHSPLEDGAHRGRHQSYCDEMCAKSAMVDRDINAHRKETRAFHAAWDVVLRSKNPLCTCLECGVEFRPRRPKETFCSPSCAHTHRGRLTRRPARTCPTCGDSFQPRNSTQAHCSHECYSEAKKTVPTHNCEQCGKTYRPTSNAPSRFCSKACHYAHGHDAVHPVTCGFCGNHFLAKVHKAKYCGNACLISDRRLRLGQVARGLSPHVFDHFVSVPALAACKL